MFKGTHWSKMPNRDEIRAKISASKTGKKLSPELREKWSITAKRCGSGKWMKGRTGDSGNNYKGDKAGYSALHMWIKYHLGKPSKCSNGHIAKKYVWANVSGEYKRDFSDWHELCQSCNLTDKIEKHKRFSKVEHT